MEVYSQMSFSRFFFLFSFLLLLLLYYLCYKTRKPELLEVQINYSHAKIMSLHE